MMIKIKDQSKRWSFLCEFLIAYVYEIKDTLIEF